MRTKKDNEDYINYFWGIIGGEDLYVKNVNEALNKTINKVIEDYY